GGFFDHVPPPRAAASNLVDKDLSGGKALLGMRLPVVVISPWTIGTPSSPTVNHAVFDHTSVLKMIESVFNVAPLAARGTSNEVGTRLSLIGLSKQPMPGPQITLTQPTMPQKFSLGSALETVSTTVSQTGSGDPTGKGPFQRLLDHGLLKGWPAEVQYRARY